MSAILYISVCLVPFCDSASQIQSFRHVENRMRGEKRYFISVPNQLKPV